ncbi:TPA: SDR family oxidoreductase [Legionella pneumophila subsp. raphaeli]|uniref:SDR family oxidoreductase n=1 Tax=Legionella pneumophila TaxID=446 RepID=UPI0007887CEE|nr:SDR family oxidoreductase [Legionella pneumophila]HAU1191273.1 SDR family oxidoreductase [Legionella pneumophila]HBD7101554.1 SDR family oxidoreductase [Legionella pneumophila]HCO4738060.1 SDR family oxidoreductase [Legionella pneumophila]HDU7928558.1 SDR family oxidoreductase [Legionella pneumophila]HDU7934689.1 SDR family oxidoreductase [Legionella pneumophila]
MTKMDKKIIVITGCSKTTGVGYNLACEMLNRGHQVIATVRNLETSQIDKANISNSSHLDIKTLDLCDEHSIDRFIKEVLTQYQYIDVLVNNAANVVIGPVESATTQDVLTTYQTKVLGPLTLIRGFVPVMRERKKGLLTTTSTIFTSVPFSIPGIAIYFSALAAFERLQESLAIELAPWNIKVINFQPGPIATELTRFEGSRSDIVEKYYKNFTEQAYLWFHQNTVFQTAAEVAKVFAEVIDMENPDLCYQSNLFGRQFVAKNKKDTTGREGLNELLEHFKNLPHDNPDDWKIQ